MKRLKIRSSLLVGLVALLFSFPNIQKGELKDIAKPYLGVYECTDAKLSDEDLLTRFDDLKLELKDKGEYVFYWKEKGGKTRKIRGKYRYDKDGETITLHVRDSRILRREFWGGGGKWMVTGTNGVKKLRMQNEKK